MESLYEEKVEGICSFESTLARAWGKEQQVFPKFRKAQ